MFFKELNQAGTDRLERAAMMRARLRKVSIGKALNSNVISIF
jgi:hypothetical protein